MKIKIISATAFMNKDSLIIEFDDFSKIDIGMELSNGNVNLRIIEIAHTYPADLKRRLFLASTAFAAEQVAMETFIV